MRTAQRIEGSEQAGSPAPCPPVSCAVTGVAALVDVLAQVDGADLSDRERVDLVAALERVKGAASAAQARVTHALRLSREEVDPRDVARSVGSQVALARRCSPTLGDRFVGLARALVEEMPRTHAALTQGVCGERHAVVMAQATAVLSVDDRAEVDRRVGPLLGRLGVRQTERAARRVAAELDAAAVVRRMEEAVRSRRVTVRPAPDGMAYLTVLGPMVEVVGAHATLQATARAVVGGQCFDEAPAGRGVGAVAADTALRLLSGRVAPGQVQPVEVHVVMTDRSLFGTGDPARSVHEPARVPGLGSLPAPAVRAWLRRGTDDDEAGSRTDTNTGTRTRTGTGTGMGVITGTGTEADVGDRTRAAGEGTTPATVWLRRLYAGPDGRDLVAMDSRRRVFTGLLRRMLVLRDDVCTTPWCEAPIAHADHLTPVREGGVTDYATGNGRCARCNHVKEAPGWAGRLADRHADRHADRPADRPADRRDGPRVVVTTTPTGHTYRSSPPPLLGWGSEPPFGRDSEPLFGRDSEPLFGWGSEPRPGRRNDLAGAAAPPSGRGKGPGRVADLRRARVVAGRDLPIRRVRASPRLDRDLCRMLV